MYSTHTRVINKIRTSKSRQYIFISVCKRLGDEKWSHHENTLTNSAVGEPGIKTTHI